VAFCSSLSSTKLKGDLDQAVNRKLLKEVNRKDNDNGGKVETAKTERKPSPDSVQNRFSCGIQEAHNSIIGIRVDPRDNSPGNNDKQIQGERYVKNLRNGQQEISDDKHIFSELKEMLEQSISRVLFPISVTLYGTMIIYLAPILLLGSSNLPWGSGGQPSNAPLFGLALGGVYHASNVTIEAVSSYLAFSPLPDRMAQPSNQAVYFLWHFPSRHRDWVLPSTLPCRARTFLHSMRSTEQRPFVLL
jgi:hypothetical protein